MASALGFRPPARAGGPCSRLAGVAKHGVGRIAVAQRSFGAATPPEPSRQEPSPTHSHAALPAAPAAAQPAATGTRGAGGWRAWKLPLSVRVDIGTALCFLNVSVAQFRQGTPLSGLFFLMWALVAAVLAFIPLKAQWKANATR